MSDATDMASDPGVAPATPQAAVDASRPARGRAVVRTVGRGVASFFGSLMVRHLLMAVAAFGVVVLITFNANFNTNTAIATSACFVAVIAGLSVLTGVSGQISLGNGAFMAVGAYGACLWLNHHPGQPYIVALLIAVAAGTILGIIVGLPATRLSGPYLAGMTLAFMLALQQALSYPSWASVFGGDGGIEITNEPNPPQWLINHSQSPVVNGFGVAQERYFAWIASIGALVVLVVMANLLRSRFGRQFRLVRDDDVAAELMGVRVARTRVFAFATSAACAGLGGGLYVIVSGGVTSSTFGIVISISLVAAMVIGGTGTLLGAVWGGIVLGFAGEWIGRLDSWLHVNPGSNVGANLEALIFGGLLIVFILVAPGGFQRSLTMLGHKVRSVLTRRRRAAPAVALDAPGAT